MNSNRPTNAEPGLTLDRVHFSHDGVALFQDLSWELPHGQCAVVTGPTGTGKSTLLYLAAGLILPHSGAVLQKGYPLSNLLPSSRVHKGLRVGFVFQEGGLLANLSAYANITLPLQYHSDVFGLSEQAIGERAEKALDEVELPRRKWQSLPAHLSYGLRKRLLTARALAFEPNFFFFDDPDVGMDQQTARITHQILCKMRDDPEVTLLVGTNRALLVERLEVPGYQIQSGKLARQVSRESMPPRSHQ